MLYQFLSDNRDDLVRRCRDKVARRGPPQASPVALAHGIALFLDQLIKTLRLEQGGDPAQGIEVSGASGGDRSQLSEIGAGAALHGRELLLHGFSVDQVVHDYGDLCQAVTDLAYESGEAISVDEFRTLNRCLDNAIADAVTEFASRREANVTEMGVQSLNQHLGFLAHELRNLIQQATLAVTVMRAGSVGLTGATGDVLDRSLVGLRNLIDRSLTEVRVTAGLQPQLRRIVLADFIADINISGSLEAQSRRCALTVSAVAPDLLVSADRDMLFSAVGNLLQNAFKYTAHRSEVFIVAYAIADRVLIDVEDRCGGLSDDAVAKMFMPFKQSNPDRSGLGLGLAITKRSVEANNGSLRVRNLPGVGCVFTIDLPRYRDPVAGALAVDTP